MCNHNHYHVTWLLATTLLVVHTLDLGTSGCRFIISPDPSPFQCTRRRGWPIRPTWLLSQVRPSHSAAFRINTRREDLAHCPCIFGSILRNTTKHDVKEHDVIQICTLRCQPKQHTRTAIAIVSYFLMVENAKSVGQLPKLLVMRQLFTG